MTNFEEVFGSNADFSMDASDAFSVRRCKHGRTKAGTCRKRRR